jgi:hypothetical protein
MSLYLLYKVIVGMNDANIVIVLELIFKIKLFKQKHNFINIQLIIKLMMYIKKVLLILKV